MGCAARACRARHREDAQDDQHDGADQEGYPGDLAEDGEDLVVPTEPVMAIAERVCDDEQCCDDDSGRDQGLTAGEHRCLLDVLGSARVPDLTGVTNGRRTTARCRPPGYRHWGRGVVPEDDPDLVPDADVELRERQYRPYMRTVGLAVARLRRINPLALDFAAAGALLVGLAAERAARDAPAPAVLAEVALCGAVTLRHRVPAGAVLFGLVCASLIDLLDGQQPAISAVVVALTYYSLGRHSGERGFSPIDLMLILLPIPAIATSPSTASPGNPLIVDVVSVWAFFVLGPFVAGRAVGSWSRMNGRLRANAAELEHEHRERVRRAAAQERMRVARELHDVVAHSVSVMVIQASAAQRVVDHDPAAAREALRAVESCGREALADLRRMVGVLHRDDGNVLGASIAGLSELERLADGARAAGLVVEVCVEGVPSALPPALDLVSFRIVQEALTNAAKHAGPTHVRVRIAYVCGGLELEIVDNGRDTSRTAVRVEGSGHGLLGMRERVMLYGGELQTGWSDDGGFRVNARLPLAEVALT